MQQIAREANTKFWGIGQSFVTLTLRFDMHDIRAFGRENWPFVRLHGTKNNTLPSENVFKLYISVGQTSLSGLQNVNKFLIRMSEYKLYI